MTPSELTTLLPELQDMKFARQSNTHLLSYLRTYYALYVLVRDNALSDEYGTPEVYRHKLQILCRTLYRRYQKATDYAQRVQLLDALYAMHYATCITTHTTMADRYFAEAEQLITQYPQEKTDPDLRYHIIRIILSQYYGFTDTPSGLNKVISWFDQIASQLSDEGRWNGVTATQAVQRIHLLSTYTAFYNDARYDEIIRKASARYLSLSATDDYSQLYDTVRDAVTIGTDPRPMLDAITENLPDTPMAHAIKIENTCRQITDQIQSALVF